MVSDPLGDSPLDQFSLVVDSRPLIIDNSKPMIIANP